MCLRSTAVSAVFCLFVRRWSSTCLLQVWRTLFDLGESKKGREKIAEGMRVCPKLLETPDDVAQLADWASSAWDYMVSQCSLQCRGHCLSLQPCLADDSLHQTQMQPWTAPCDSQAMGNYPYPSTYILNGGGEMPAFPVRVACESMRAEDMSTRELLPAFADSLGIFYNYSKVRTVWPAARNTVAGPCRGRGLTCSLRHSSPCTHSDMDWGSHITQALAFVLGLQQAQLCAVALAGCGVLRLQGGRKS